MTRSITHPIDVIGTASDDNLLFYTLSVAPVGSTAFAEIARGTTHRDQRRAGHVRPDDAAQRQLRPAPVGHRRRRQRRRPMDETFDVAGDLKLGNFTLSFTDLTVPVSGIPITVTRTYDTLTARDSDDFGFGWRLEFRDMDLRTSVRADRPRGDGSASTTRSADGQRVYVTLPGGKREGFTFQPPSWLPASRGGFLGIFEPAVRPRPGRDELADGRAGRSSGSTLTAECSTTPPALPYNPRRPDFGGSYLLTTKDGIAYDIDASDRPAHARSATPTATPLTFTDAGITSPPGRQSPSSATRRAASPASSIRPATRPLPVRRPRRPGRRHRPHGQHDTVRLRSSPAALPDQVIDPLGRTGVRTEYDAQGRLTKLIDAAGKPVQFAYDPTHCIETVTDPLGNPTTYEYDARGNIVGQIDALGGVTRRTYDARQQHADRDRPARPDDDFHLRRPRQRPDQDRPARQHHDLDLRAFTFGTTAEAAVQGRQRHRSPAWRPRPTRSATPPTTATIARGNLVAQTDAAGQYDHGREQHGGQPDADYRPARKRHATTMYDGVGNLHAVDRR